MHVNISAAKARLSELVRRAESGEEVLLMRNNLVVAKLVPTQQPKKKRTLFVAKGEGLGPLHLEAFFALDEEIARDFEDSDVWPQVSEADKEAERR